MPADNGNSRPELPIARERALPSSRKKSRQLQCFQRIHPAIAALLDRAQLIVCVRASKETLSLSP
jgi:hypothetical protein